MTGGSGLVGSAIAKRLTGKYELLTPSRQELDLLDPTSLDEYINSNDFEICIHAAAVVMGLGGNLSKPGESLSKNTQIDLNLFESLAKSKVNRLIYISTVAAYGHPYSQLPLVEADFFRGPPHLGEYGYGSSKRLAHAHAEAIRVTNKVATSYLVLTNVFGENDRFDQHTGHVIPALIEKAAIAGEKDSPLYVWGKPETTRDFIYSGDLATAVEKLIPLNHHGILNVSSGKSISMSDVVTFISREFGIDRIEWQKDQPIGIPHRTVSNRQLKSLIDFDPHVFDVALTKTINWYKDNKESLRK